MTGAGARRILQKRESRLETAGAGIGNISCGLECKTATAGK